ncbi:MAG: non-heme iron oxygenase ferredoxin subunit [Phycisphaerales bacterium]|nr:non-heme iron oxygenase ferredoxin subunit [Phycisphaerales bacterium]
MPEYHKAASMTELVPGSIICVEVAGTRVALYNLEGEIFATSPSCTHVEADLADGDIEGEEVVCPLHFATFNIKTGLCTSPPAEEDLVTYAVRVTDDCIEVEI